MTSTSKTEPFGSYCANPALNHSRLKKMETSALAFHVNAQMEDTKPLFTGRLNHLCTLQHNLFLDTVTVWEGGMTIGNDPRPTMNKNSKAYKEFAYNAERNGQTVVDKDEIAQCERSREAILRHPIAGKLIACPDHELSIYWDHPLGPECKSLIDTLASDKIGDLKFLRDISPRRVNRAILDYGYHTQAAMYQDAVQTLTGEKRPYFLIAADKAPPFDVVVYELDDAILDFGRQKYTRWLERFVDCKMHDRWPGISDESIKAELPNWAYEDEITDRISFAGMEIESA